MPGMNGIETSQKICEIYSGKKIEHPIIIAQSGDSDENFHNQFKMVGISSNITKPFSFGNFRDLLKEYHII